MLLRLAKVAADLNIKGWLLYLIDLAISKAIYLRPTSLEDKQTSNNVTYPY